MYEFVYVLTVEAFCFGLLGVVLVAQTLDIFALPANKVWPVLSTSILFVLVYVQILLFLCCAISVSKFGVLAHGMMDACARSAGRLVYVVVLSLCYVTVLLLNYDLNYDTRNVPGTSKKYSLQCLLAQLLGTNCSNANAVLWSYNVYLSVMLPVIAFVAALQVIAAGMCKNSKKSSHARLLCANSAYVLVYTVNYTLSNNARCNQACNGLTVTSLDIDSQQAQSAPCFQVFILLLSLCVSDIVAEYFLRRGSLHSKVHSKLNVAIFCCIRLAQLASVPLFDVLTSTAGKQSSLPWQLLMTHIIIASIVCLIDLMEIVVPFISGLSQLSASGQSRRDNASVESVKPRTRKLPKLQTPILPAVAVRPFEPFDVKPFELDNGSRKKFIMTFGGQSRWPGTFNVESGKKTT